MYHAFAYIHRSIQLLLLVVAWGYCAWREQVKETVLALVSLLKDLKMDTHVLMNLVRQLREPFRKLLLLAFEGECRRILQGETYQPLDVQVRGWVV